MPTALQRCDRFPDVSERYTRNGTFELSLATPEVLFSESLLQDIDLSQVTISSSVPGRLEIFSGTTSIGSRKLEAGSYNTAKVWTQGCRVGLGVTLEIRYTPCGTGTITWDVEGVKV